MSNSPIHCPLCNTKKVSGLGLVIYEQSALVEYRCRGCGELFFLADQRGQLPVQTSEQNTSSSDHVLGDAANPASNDTAN